MAALLSPATYLPLFPLLLEFGLAGLLSCFNGPLDRSLTIGPLPGFFLSMKSSRLPLFSLMNYLRLEPSPSSLGPFLPTLPNLKRPPLGT